MKTILKMFAVCLMLMLLVSSPVAAQSKAAAAFERLKALAGEWEGTVEGKAGRITYKVVSNGTAVLESISGQGHEDGMISIYHFDGENLMMTHYCSMGNQPRMRATPADVSDTQIIFRLVDTTNVKSADEGQITGLVTYFGDGTQFTQEWSGRGQGKVSTTVFRWTRKK